MNPAIFLDRDGVINSLEPRNGYSPRIFSDFVVLPFVKEALEKFHHSGFYIFIHTNQPDISRGLMLQTELDKMHSFLKNDFFVDEIVTCPHDDTDNCICRKPNPGMIFYLAEKWQIDLNKSVLIGDSVKDLKAAYQARVKFILLKNEFNSQISYKFEIRNLLEAVNLLKILITPKNE